MIYLKHYQSRIIVAFFLLFFEYVSNCLLVNISNGLYFAVCGLFNVLLIILLPKIQGTNFIDDLMKLNYAALLIQFVGWLLYENYVQPNAFIKYSISNNTLQSSSQALTIPTSSSFSVLAKSSGLSTRLPMQVSTGNLTRGATNAELWSFTSPIGILFLIIQKVRLV